MLEIAEGIEMLRLLRTRACTRCGGDLSLERDEYGTYVECIQCGAVWNELDLIYQPHPVSERQVAGIAKPTVRDDNH